MFRWPAQPDSPGLFITGTDTGVGKTAVTCGIAAVLAARTLPPGAGVARPAACKPFATGCQRSRAGWSGEDIAALATAAGVRADEPAALQNLCPQAFELPASPAAAAAQEKREIDYAAIGSALLASERGRTMLLVEGIGGPKVPLDPRQPRYCVAEFAADLGYPVLLVARAGLGTLSHTAMSVESLQSAGCRVVGVVLNDPDGAAADDPTAATNPAWIERMTGIKVLASLPRIRDLQPGTCPPAAFERLSAVDWAGLGGRVTLPSEAPVW